MTKPTTWEELMDPLERLSEQLSRPWGVVSHLKGVRDSDELRQAYDEMQPKVVGASLRIGEGEGGSWGRARDSGFSFLSCIHARVRRRRYHRSIDRYIHV